MDCISCKSRMWKSTILQRLSFSTMALIAVTHRERMTGKRDEKEDVLEVGK